MRTIRTTLKLHLDQVRRLESLAEQSGLTPEQIVSAVAVLALNQQIGEPQIPEVERIEKPTPARRAAESTLGRPTGYVLPDTGFLRLTEIVGRPAMRGQPALPRLVPVSRSTWLAGVKSGVYPKPINLGGRVTAWRVEDIRALIQQLGSAEG
jgi:predicted DNA-binding transcriptional regulator AlpA